MHTFEDAKGRVWTLDLTVAAVKRVKALAGVDLLDAAAIEKLARLSAADLIALVDVIYAICKPAADATGVDAESFGEALIGDPLGAACAALLPEIIRFFPDPKRRQALQTIYTTTREAMDLLADHAVTTSATLTARTLADAALAAANASGVTSGSAPAFLESTPAPSPTPNS